MNSLSMKYFFEIDIIFVKNKSQLNMRNLTNTEITALQNQHCNAENWQNISVAENFSTEHIYHVSFSGRIILETDICIYRSAIANYHIKKGAYINNVNALIVEGKTSFGNGTEVCVLNEAGGREVKIFDLMSAHTAYILAMSRHRPQLINSLNNLIDKYVAEKTTEIGEIGENARITNCGVIRNVKIGNGAQLENVSELRNGTVCEQAFVGTGVIARHFIISKGSKVYDYALLDKCFIGEACEVGKQFSATDSLFFCNSQLLHGEAVAVFGGPYTISHHKSTLLIGCMFSFYNAGSGTNQSNHMYKLGPVHQGVLERGVKTGSDSYLMLAARAGAFSLILGHHEQHFDTSDFPFSYILEDGGKSLLIPAVNFQTVGTQRDAQKWLKRDGRKNDEKLDQIIFDLLNPYIIQKIRRGTKVLEEMKQKEADFHTHKNIRIKNVFVSKGIRIYESAVICYLGKKLIEKLSLVGFDKKMLKPTTAIGKNNWVDLSGFVIPQDLLEENLLNIENQKFNSIDAVNAFFSNCKDDYSLYEWNFVYHLLESIIGKSFDEMQKDDIVSFIELYGKTLASVTDAIIADAGKEFNATSMVSFGVDGCEDTQRMDFENVRGTCASNPFVLEVIRNKELDLENIKLILEKLINE